jgi:hypothetical protein
MPVLFNVIVSGASVSGDLSTLRNKLVIDLGNSDKIGKVTFSLQNKGNIYSSYLFSGNATVQIDAIPAPGITKTIFRGTLEEAYPVVDTRQGSEVDFVGFDYAQELLGLVSPDARQTSLTSGGVVSVTSGDQGMGSLNGMDLVLFVSGVVGSGSTGSITSGAQLNLFMSQYFGRSGDTTGSNSGQLFSFKPYTSGMSISGANAFYRTWYAQDGASDTNANYWIPYDRLKVKHEYAWDVLRKLTRQGRVVDRSGFKVQLEVYVGVSGDINIRTSGTSNFVASGISLVYYQTGNSGVANNNIKQVKTFPWSTTGLKDYIVGWFPTWSNYPFSDDYSDIVSYSGAYWSGTSSFSGVVVLSGTLPAPGILGLISITGMVSGLPGGAANSNVNLVFTFWSGYTLNILRWNVSGGQGVALNYNAQGQTDANGNLANFSRSVMLIDQSGNAIIKSGQSSSNGFDRNLVLNSGWTNLSEIIFTVSGTFLSGTGGDGGWASGGTGMSGQFFSGGVLKQIIFGFNGQLNMASIPKNPFYAIDNVNFQFAYNFNPVTAFNSGAVSSYRRRYEVFEFPYQVTDSGAADILNSELLSKQSSRQLAEFVVKDNPNLGFSAQLGITPGQAFVVDAPALAAGSGQFYYYFVATEVRYEWGADTGFETYIKAYPWFSGQTVGSGSNLISYSLPLPIPLPRPVQAMPITHWWFSKGG